MFCHSLLLMTALSLLRGVAGSSQMHDVAERLAKAAAPPEPPAGVVEDGGFAVERRSFPPGEASKSLEVAAELFAWLAERRAERDHPLVALGGGVSGDLVGFVAATYLRGVPLVQVPTTLLAQIDSSIGGKKGVNLPEGKNLVGASHQPDLVVVDPLALKTLPER